MDSCKFVRKRRNVVHTSLLDKFCIGCLLAINGSENYLNESWWCLLCRRNKNRTWLLLATPQCRLAFTVWRMVAGMVFALTFERTRRSFIKALEGKPYVIETQIMVWDLPKIYARMFRCIVLVQWKSTSGKGAMLVILGSNLYSSLLIFIVRRKRKDYKPR